MKAIMRKKELAKRIFGVTLTLVLAVGLLPGFSSVAFASESGDPSIVSTSDTGDPANTDGTPSDLTNGGDSGSPANADGTPSDLTNGGDSGSPANADGSPSDLTNGGDSGDLVTGNPIAPQNIQIQPLEGIVGLSGSLDGGYGSSGKFLAPIDPPAAGSIPISTRSELEKIGNDDAYPLDGDYYLTNDIDLSGSDWVSIGTYNLYFSGVFDGQGHVIHDMTIISEAVGSEGLFVFVTGVVKNVGLEGTNINIHDDYAGGICGFNYGVVSNCYNEGDLSTSYPYGADIGGICGWSGGSIDDCYNAGDVSVLSSPSNNSSATAGGICGYLEYDSEISNCHNTGNVTALAISLDTTYAHAYAGGICGDNYSGYDDSYVIGNCYNTGTVSAYSSAPVYSSMSYAGGICGDMNAFDSMGAIGSCYNTGNVLASSSTNSSDPTNIATSYAGGIAGYDTFFYDQTSIIDCFNTGYVSSYYSSSKSDFSDASAGGICGENSGGSIVENCYSIGPVAGSSLGGICGINLWTIKNCYTNNLYGSQYGTQLTTGQMKAESNFAGFDFSNVWGISASLNNGYPYLRNLEVAEWDESGFDFAPAIVTQPISQVVFVGDTATLTVVATGAGTLGYQWQKLNGKIWVDISGANANTYTTPLLSLSDDGSKFRCIVTNQIAGGGEGQTVSGIAMLLVNSIPMELQLDTTTAVPVEDGQITRLAFTPSVSDYYTFSSSGDEDTYGYLYNAYGILITSDDNSGDGYNFSLTFFFYAGETYYFGVKHNSSLFTGDIMVKLYEVPPEPQSPICQIGSIGYTSLDDAIYSIDDGGSATIKLLTDINYSWGLYIYGQNITFDLNGFKLNIVDDSGWNTGLTVNDGEVLLKDPDNGELNVTGSLTGLEVLNGGKAEVTTATATGTPGLANFYKFYGVAASWPGSEAIVHGSVVGEVMAMDDSKIAIEGDVEVVGYQDSNEGISAIENAEINIGGNVTVTEGVQGSSSCTGLIASEDATISVGGSVKVSSSGDLATGASASDNAEITIGGSILTSGAGDNVYLSLQNIGDLAKGDFTTPTTKPGYLTYTNGSCSIWVSDGETPIDAGAAVAADILALTVGSVEGANTDAGSVKSNLAALPLTGGNGTTISWSSSNPDFISDTGVVTRPAYKTGDQQVKLTATVSKDSASDTVSFDFTLPACYRGDVNGDDEINILDIMAVRDYIFGKGSFGPQTVIALDVTNDTNDQINIFDIMAIRDYIFGKTSLS